MAIWNWIKNQGAREAITEALRWCIALAWPTIVAVGAAVLAITEPLSLTAIYLAAIGAFTMACATMVLIPIVQRQRSIFRSISVDEIGLLDARLNQDGKKIPYLILSGKLKNKSQRDIFFKFKRLDISIQEKTRADGFKGEGDVCFILAGDSYPFGFGTIRGLDATKQMVGSVEIKIEYGPKEDDLRYVFRYEGSPLIGVIHHVDEKKADFSILAQVKKLAHEKK